MAAHGPASLFADISSNDQAFHAHAYRSAGHRVIAIKATENTGYVNPYYAAWVDAAHAAGLAVIHYHFARPESGDPLGQAEHFWNTVKARYRKGPDRLCWDVETGNPGQAAGWLDEADQHLHDLSGQDAVLYTYESYLNEAGGRLQVRSRRAWIAKWGNHSPAGKLIGGLQLWAWQYTDGRGYGAYNQHYAGVIGAARGGACDGSIINRRSLQLIEAALRAHGDRLA